ncbi:multidrug transporter subunit MdtN [Pseudomonas fluorescens]|uniref:Multidrug resistance protein MdtN n=1 Tax=Pseudomonas fluorescens TaxID=294 RepID=A0A0F4TZG0_PSEFL|nr:multidrug transporter subunit MdtN [Pseudomonas fluorescens]KJZ49449.1 multidrug resistance protein MdtN [Pseudomonas fluorescens]
MSQAINTRAHFGRAIALLLVLAAIALAIFVAWRIDTAPRTDDAYAYADTINVAPDVSGRIVDLAVKDNQAVKKGDVLFQIDARPFQATLAKAEASLVALENQIELTQRSVNAQKFGAAAAKADIERARANAEQTSDTLGRLEPLLRTHFVSVEEVDRARAAKRAAQAQLSTSELDARRASAGISGVDALVAKREVIKAEIALAQLNLEYATVRAPFDGIVINLKTSAGQYAAAGHPIFTLANTSRWYVVANFRETELEHIKAGQTAQVYVLSDSSKQFQGVVESVGYGVFPDDGGGEVSGLPHVPRSINWVRVNQRFPVRIAVEQPDPSVFRIGASAVAVMTSDMHATAH